MSIWAAKRDDRAGADEGRQRLVKILRLHRGSRVNVLLVGGSDTGRAALARTFHENSPVSTGQLLQLDCPDDEGLLADALRARMLAPRPPAPDVLTACENGTLYLDHIEHLSLETQRLLLAAIHAMSGGHGSWVGRLITGGDVELEGSVSGDRFLPDLLDILDKVKWELGPESSGAMQ